MGKVLLDDLKIETLVNESNNIILQVHILKVD
jgi:hypothetical protein